MSDSPRTTTNLLIRAPHPHLKPVPQSTPNLKNPQRTALGNVDGHHMKDGHAGITPTREVATPNFLNCIADFAHLCNFLNVHSPRTTTTLLIRAPHHGTRSHCLSVPGGHAQPRGFFLSLCACDEEQSAAVSPDFRRFKMRSSSPASTSSSPQASTTFPAVMYRSWRCAFSSSRSRASRSRSCCFLVAMASVSCCRGSLVEERDSYACHGPILSWVLVCPVWRIAPVIWRERSVASAPVSVGPALAVMVAALA